MSREAAPWEASLSAAASSTCLDKPRQPRQSPHAAATSACNYRLTQPAATTRTPRVRASPSLQVRTAACGGRCCWTWRCRRRSGRRTRSGRTCRTQSFPNMPVHVLGGSPAYSGLRPCSSCWTVRPCSPSLHLATVTTRRLWTTKRLWTRCKPCSSASRPRCCSLGPSSRSSRWTTRATWW